jgi:hypothetical protein
MQPVWPLVVVAAALLAIVIVEGSGPEGRPTDAHPVGLPAGQ